ncbi:ATP-dependent Clp protease ATP-binding subunit [Candidatus Uhrbacteria bacterium]|nr:ATP-dependent Clp protease ATP-binding subunit [Candidatus Uhrbacteria bacterium]
MISMEFLQRFALIFVVVFGAGLLWYAQNRKKSAAPPPGGAHKPSLKNLTQMARDGKIDAVVGREEEIERVIHIISRRTKNNPLLIGEPGVGKTAIVEGFAHRIVKGDVPESLKGKEILELNLSELISGTKYRGEFEERLRSITKELESAPRSTILFIDEIHVIEQTKGTEGAMSASDILKPALARGDLPIIGATTWREYSMYIRPDPALDRRFQPVLVAEPSREAALSVLRGIKPIYEAYHHVVIDDDALAAAVDLSTQLLKDRFLPDKAIDVIDEAAAKVAIEASGHHRVQMGVVHAAAEEAKRKAGIEAGKLTGELDHMQSLDKEFPGDPAIMSAEKTLKRHLDELAAVTKEGGAEGTTPRVTRTDVEEVVKLWAELGKASK